MYTVFGYNDLCESFKYKFDSFVAAVKAFRKLQSSGCMAFVERGNSNTCLFIK